MMSCKQQETDLERDVGGIKMKDEEEWKKKLSDETYRVMREKDTERPFTGKYYKHKEKGTYLCAACGSDLFSSDAKYESGTGWPSFNAPAGEDAVDIEQDNSLGLVRTEVHCAKCGGHLGHVFDDGPRPTGKRYCINSASLDFKKE
jgi:peptide-methionine (R)-S-oxide reductase